jgi:hypothetical protein
MPIIVIAMQWPNSETLVYSGVYIFMTTYP